MPQIILFNRSLSSHALINSILYPEHWQTYRKQRRVNHSGFLRNCFDCDWLSLHRESWKHRPQGNFCSTKIGNAYTLMRHFSPSALTFCFYKSLNNCVRNLDSCQTGSSTTQSTTSENQKW